MCIEPAKASHVCDNFVPMRPRPDRLKRLPEQYFTALRARLRNRVAMPLDADEFANRFFGRTTLEAHHEPDVECSGKTLQRRHARRVLAALDARDRRVTGPHPLGKLGLRQSELHPVLGYEASDILVRGEALLLPLVRSAPSRAPAPCFARRFADGSPWISHAGSLLVMGLPYQFW